METSFVFFHNVYSKHTHITPIMADRTHVPLLKKNISLSNKHESNCVKNKKNEINACLNICMYAHNAYFYIYIWIDYLESLPLFPYQNKKELKTLNTFT